METTVRFVDDEIQGASTLLVETSQHRSLVKALVPELAALGLEVHQLESRLVDSRRQERLVVAERGGGTLSQAQRAALRTATLSAVYA